MKSLLLLSTLSSLALAVQSSPSTPASKACQALSSKLPGKVAFDPLCSASYSNETAYNTTGLGSLYNSTQQSYWDTANTADFPECMVFPSSASDVSTAIKVLGSFPSVPFALKSGGHNWNRGFSSTNGGVLISFRPNLQDVTISQDRNTVDVGPGAKWRDVMGELDKYGRCAVGGRNDDVGVGGYVILGGISYLTAQYGWSSDGVVNFEVVLANGTIVDANATHNADLYFSLRGGGNNFGVVTKYTLLTHPIGQVWGGVRTYSAEHTPQMLSAIANYTSNFSANVSKSAIIANIFWLGGNNTWSINFFWDGPSPPAHVFADFDAIPHLTDLTATQSYPGILKSDSGVVGRTTDRVNPLANLPHDDMVAFLQWHYAQANATAFRNFQDPSFTFLIMAVQPVPVDLQRAKAVGVPGALSVDPDGGDKLWIEYSLAWKNDSMDAHMVKQLANLTDTAQEYQKQKYLDAGVRPTKYRSGRLPDVAFNPLLGNDAQTGQSIFKSYGQPAYQQLVETRRRFDPGMFFQRRTSGFHLELP